MIIGFMGKKQSGKDTAAKFLINKLSQKNLAQVDVKVDQVEKQI